MNKTRLTLAFAVALLLSGCVAKGPRFLRVSLPACETWQHIGTTHYRHTPVGVYYYQCLHFHGDIQWVELAPIGLLPLGGKTDAFRN